MEDIIERMKLQLKEFKGLEYSSTDDSITVRSTHEDGFMVIFWAGRDQSYVVNYGHYWHGHFEDEEEAAKWFFAGITGRSRLVCSFRWRYLVKAVVEFESSEEWMTADTTGSCLGLLVWWLPKRIEFHRNSLPPGISL